MQLVGTGVAHYYPPRTAVAKYDRPSAGLVGDPVDPHLMPTCVCPAQLIAVRRDEGVLGG